MSAAAAAATATAAVGWGPLVRNVIAGNAVCAAVLWLGGFAVQNYAAKVNYTRKAYHFAVMMWAMWGQHVAGVEYEPSPVSDACWGLCTTLHFALMCKPLRTRSSFVDRCYACVDRPEDRPYTLQWAAVQMLLTWAVVIPLQLLLLPAGQAGRDIIALVGFINGFGDGLAEPVGVRFGRHKYRVRALVLCRSSYSSSSSARVAAVPVPARSSPSSSPASVVAEDASPRRYYTRSIEGSLCVLAFGVLGVWLWRAVFATTAQFMGALLLLPAALTLAEAVSPHTLDTPFLFLVGCSLASAIVKWL